MQIFRYPERDVKDMWDLPYTQRPSAVAIGVFDGVHRAHREVISRIIGIDNLVPTVLTFADSPAALPKAAVPLSTGKQKEVLLERLGVEQMVEMDFAAVCQLSGKQFVDTILCEFLQARVVVCGSDFRFGAGGAADVAVLRRLCEERDIRLTVVPTVFDGDEPIGSSRIRRLLADGQVREASRLLGYPYGFTAKVNHGKQLGQTAGFPTINQKLPHEMTPLRHGVYASVAVVEGRSVLGVTNVGHKPTVGGTELLAETHLLDFSGNLYAKRVTVYPVRFLRDEQTFADTEALFAQVAADCETVRAMYRPTGMIRAVLFDFDDTLHSRVEAWRQFSLQFVRELFPEADETEQQQKAHELWEMGGCGRGFRPGEYVDIPYETLFGELKEKWGLSDRVDKLIRRCHQLFAGCVQVFADTVPSLRKLKEAGLTVGIITNGRSFLQNRKLYYSGLLPELDCAVVAGDEEVSKPNPELFRRTALRLGIPPEDCAYVGDNPLADLAGARSAGMLPLYLDRYGERLASPAYGDLTAILNCIIL